MLLASELTKTYVDATVLNGVSLSLRPGEITVVLGPSGSGKTTLLRCLSLLETPDSGEIRVDGLCYSFPQVAGRPGGTEGLAGALPGRPAFPALYPKLGVVLQNLALWPHLTLRENIRLPLRVLGLVSHSAYAEQLIDTFKMRSFIDQYPSQASGGQRQRTALVRALALRPAYLLLDEITSALDVEQVVIVLKELERLKQAGTGILLITHLLGFARRAADHFLFLNESRAVEWGNIAALERPRTQRLKEFLGQALEAL